MDPNTALATIGISAATALVTKGADAPAKTLNLLWEATIGRLNPYLENMIEEHNQNVKKYSDAIKQEITDIPPEQINQSPDISVLGPALEASKFYVENEEIRNMFAKLIGSEFDLRKAGKIHHSFVDIIRQMSSNDARLFPKLPRTGPLAEIKVFTKGGDTYLRVGPQYILLIPPDITDNFENNAVSLNNLSRLGLIEISTQFPLTNKAHYAAYETLSYYQQANQILSQDPNTFSKVEISKGAFTFTAYGDLFKTVCL